MLKFDLPQPDERYLVWLQLCTRDELSSEFRTQMPSLSDQIRQSGDLVVYSPYNNQITHTIPYTELLAAFPDADPETTYPLMHFEYYAPRFMYQYIVKTQVETILDTVMTVTDWIELYPLEDAGSDLSEPGGSYPDATPETVIPVRQTLTGEILSVPFSRLMEEFPSLDPARTTVITSYGVEFEGSITQEALDAECAKRGWRSVRVPHSSHEEAGAREDALNARYPDLKTDDAPLFLYIDQGFRLTIRASYKR